MSDIAANGFDEDHAAPPVDRAEVGDPLADRLRAAGCVFAEAEAAVLRERAGDDVALLEELTARRAAGAPLEPLVGWVDFGPVRLRVGPGVFVPRQRTLQLAERAVSELRRVAPGRRPVFVEAFAGIAPVASAVRQALPEAMVVACEREAAARVFAARNLGSAGTVHGADILDGAPEGLRGRVDVIAAVPPYVPDAEVALLPREAREYEPLPALAGGVDGLRWARALIDQAPGWLAPGGRLMIELHHAQRSAAVSHARGVGLFERSGRTAPASPGTFLTDGAEDRWEHDLTMVLTLVLAPSD